MRLNNANQTLATRLWVSQNDDDGLDVSIGLAKVLPGHQIYVQDYDDASKWVKYSVTTVSDDGAYYDYTVAFHSGPGGMAPGSGAAGRVEFQPVAPGTVGIPPGGAVGQIIGKTGAADFAVGWVADQVGAGGGIDAEAAVDAVAAALATPGPSGGITVVYNDAANAGAGSLVIGTSAIPTANVSGLDTALAAKETPAGAQAKVDTHVNDTTAAHVASSIGFTPNGTIAASDVQAAVVELRDDTASLLAGKADATGTTTALGTKADKATTVTGTGALSGGGDLSANRTIDVANDGISNAKLANMTTGTIKGRATAGNLDPEDLTATQVKTLLAIANTDVSGLGPFAPSTKTSIVSADIADGTVALADMANLAQDKLIGRATASTGVPEVITCTAAGRNLIDDADAPAQRTTLGLTAMATATTLASLNTAITDADVPSALNGLVGIWKGTQAQYTALGTYDANTLYAITA
jgi:hypothetical protein